MTAKPRQSRLITLERVKDITGLGQTSIYQRMKAGTFPQPVRLSSRATRWHEHEIFEWVANLPRGVGVRPAETAGAATQA